MPDKTEPQGSASSSGDEKCSHLREGGCCSGPGYCAHACAPAEPEAGPWRREPIDFGSDAAAKCGACGHMLAEHRWDQTRGSIFPERDNEIRLFRMQCAGCAVLAEPPVHDMHEFVPAPPGCEGCPDPKHGDDPCGAEGCLCQHPVPCPAEPECSACGGNDPDSCPFCADRVARGHRIEAVRQSLSSYAVAYATGSGALIELALPGDASAAVVNGALVICHPSGVLGIQHVKPCGEDA